VRDLIAQLKATKALLGGAVTAFFAKVDEMNPFTGRTRATMRRRYQGVLFTWPGELT
jgi:hypothetical protein